MYEARSLPRQWRPSNSRLIKTYLAAPGRPKKLHLGSGATHLLEGWLNTDIVPTGDVAFLDVTKPFPFQDGTFDYVFTEHVIEHVPFKKGQNLIRESCRVLRPGGKLRIVTPDFRFLVDLYCGRKSELQRAYMTYQIEAFVGSAPAYSEMFIINNFMRNWGHTFIYDRRTLGEALEAAGFDSIQDCEISQSSDPALSGLENVTRMPAGFVELESMILEAVKRGPKGQNGWHAHEHLGSAVAARD